MKKIIFRRISLLMYKSYRAVEYTFSILSQNRFRSIGDNVRYFPFSSVISYENIEIGDNVFFGHHCTIQSSVANVFVGSNVMFGPYVTLMGGDHEMGVVGQYMFDVKTKNPESDKNISIGDDVWVGAGATILKGVTVSEGAVIAAGSLVINDVKPYEIVAGVPAKAIRSRFTDEELVLHKKVLGL